MEVRVLGPVELVGADGPVRLAAMPRRLLAALVADPGKTRTVDVLIEALWGERPPRDAGKVLQLYVSRLRKALPQGARMRTDSSGYALELDEEVLDARRFERLLFEARTVSDEGNITLAASLLGRALSLWRGQAFGELAYEDFARAEAERLEELRLLALEEQSEAELRLGRHADVVGQLRELAVTHPLRERMQAQLMVALYRCGRQTEALDVYRSVRVHLGDELGLEPSEELRELQRRMLRHDPTLTIVPVPAEHLPALPTPPNRLLGRERELRELRGLLLRERARLLVLTGAGGSGKTRLALEAARATANSFANGACLVELAPLRDPKLVLGAIAGALALEVVPGQSPFETLAAALRPRELLLVVDNAEHLRAAAPLYVRLLAQAPRLSLLVTSRAVLHLSGEHVYPVEPLAEPAAVALFGERAREADSHFQPTCEDEQAIREICRRLDGLPLALELAAPRTRTFSPRELLDRLEPRLPLLTGGPRDLPARQQTLRATLEWSYDLLDAEERRDFRRLAVFAGGCTLRAAKTVCDTTPERLAALVEHSLLHRHTTPSGSRYAMLETIREFAAERLEESGEADELRRRFAAHYIALAEEAYPNLRGHPKQWLDRLESDHDNLRATFDRLEALGDTERALRLAAALHRFWYMRGYLAEGRTRLEQLLARDRRPTPGRARALNGAAVMAHNTGDDEAAKRYAKQALALHERFGDAWEAAYSRFLVGLIAGEEQDYESARHLMAQSIERFRELADDYYAHVAAVNLGRYYQELGELERARDLLNDLIRLARGSGDERSEASALGQLSVVARLQSRNDEALRLLEQSLRIWLRLGDRLMMSRGLRQLAHALAVRGDAERAAKVLSASEALREKAGAWENWYAKSIEEALELIRPALDHPAFERAWSEGRTLSAEEALALIKPAVAKADN